MPVLEIDDEGFRLDGSPFRILSGGLHYFRVHPEQWADRLHKARLMGLNTVETYVPWNLHEPRRGDFRMEGALDLPRFLDLAQAEGLHVLLRPGPFICAEWEGGGLPSWLLAEAGLRLRAQDPRYLDAADGYFEALFARVGTRLATEGGPVLAVQVENEFGAYDDDTAHLEHLAATLRRCGVEVPLLTCDQPADLGRGSLPGVLATANFGSHSADNLAVLRKHQPAGPLMCMEFWIGWFDRWGAHHVTRDTAEVAGELDELLAAGASVNFYMFHGGTNFGFTNGANDKHTYRPTVTSYDYDAPLDEAGDPTEKYAAFRDVLAKYAPVPPEPLPVPGRKAAHPEIRLTESAPLLPHVSSLAQPVHSEAPLTMEQLGQDFGFVLYRTTVAQAGPVLVEPGRIGDRAQLFLDGQPLGVLEREGHESALSFTAPRAGATLSLLVENQGRVNYGPGIHDSKGLSAPVLLNGAEQTGWSHWSLPLDPPSARSALPFAPTTLPTVGPAFHRGVFHLHDPADTYLHLDGWTKGLAWINGFALGRYWSRGPQRSLYVPGPVLRRGANEIVVLELHSPGHARTVALRTGPDLGPAGE